MSENGTTMYLSGVSLEYFNYLDSLSDRQFNKIIKSEIDEIFGMIRNPKPKYKKNFTGIFQKTPNSVKTATGVKFGKEN